jgi:hypothetical protein
MIGGMMAPPFSVWTLLGLLAVLVASSAVFWVHVQRWTYNRNWVALRDWANRNGFRLYRAKRAWVPAPLAELTLPPPNALVSMVGKRTQLLQIDTPGESAGEPLRWNVLVCELGVDWPATALRPAAHERSLVDLFRLASFPALMASDRFTIHGSDAPAARAVAGSMLMALLPQDLGLVLIGRRLVLDFSTRPFDGIELSRIVSLTEQLVAHLPGVKRGSGRGGSGYWGEAINSSSDQPVFLEASQPPAAV